MTEVRFHWKPGGKSRNWVPAQLHDLMQLQTADSESGTLTHPPWFVRSGVSVGSRVSARSGLQHLGLISGLFLHRPPLPITPQNSTQWPETQKWTKSVKFSWGLHVALPPINRPFLHSETGEPCLSSNCQMGRPKALIPCFYARLAYL